MAATITMRELPLAEAAAELRMTPEAVRMRWRRGKLKGRRDEAGRILISIEGDQAEQRPGNDRSAPGQADLVDVLKAQVSDLQRRLDAADQAQSEMRRLLLQSQAQVSDLTQRLALPAPVEAEGAAEPEPGPIRRAGFTLAMLWPWK